MGCGSYGGNSVSGNVQAVNLINVKRIARRNNNMQWFKVPAKTYFEPNAIRYLRDMYNIRRAVIICDKVMEQLGVVDKVIDQLRARPELVTFRIIDYVEPEPDDVGMHTSRAFLPSGGILNARLRMSKNFSRTSSKEISGCS